jgi:endonuclease-3
LINKTYKVLKKHYSPGTPPANRTVLEHLLYACCLENASPEAADEAFAKLQQVFYDWNEIRVTTVTELAETMSTLPDAADAATRLKKTLQHIFETNYSYDIEGLKKQNLGKASKDLEGVRGTTPFTVAYVNQHGLGGHSIPVASGAVAALQVIGVISEAEAKKQRVPGLERAIPKTKGVEFASLLHQFGADYYASPHSTKVRSIVLEIDPEAKQRLPKRAGKGEEADTSRPAQDAAGEATAGTPETPAKNAESKEGSGTTKKRTRKGSAAEAAPGKKKATRAKATTKSGSEAKRSPTKQLSRKKPR